MNPERIIRRFVNPVEDVVCAPRDDTTAVTGRVLVCRRTSFGKLGCKRELFAHGL